MPESRNTAGDLQRAARLFECKQLLGKVESNHLEVVAMMRARIPDGLGAARYGQFGGSFPDPTAGAVFDIHGDEAKSVRWRDNGPETDLEEYEADADLVHAALLRMDAKRRANLAANRDANTNKTNPLLIADPSDYCRLHRALKLLEGHRRVIGSTDGLCAICVAFVADNNREPTLTEIDYWHTHAGKWPHKLYDPKERRAV